MADIFLREVDMNGGVRAFTLPDPEGDYNVYINVNLSDTEKQITLKHEVWHIVNNDFQSEESEPEVEDENPY